MMMLKGAAAVGENGEGSVFGCCNYRQLPPELKSRDHQPREGKIISYGPVYLGLWRLL